MQPKQQPQQQFERLQVEGDSRLRHHPVVNQFKHQPLQVIHQLPNQHQVVPDEQFELLRTANKRPKPLEEPLLVYPEDQVPKEQEFEHDGEHNLDGVFVHQPEQHPQEGNLGGIIPVVNPTRSAPSVPPRNLVDDLEISNQPSTMVPLTAGEVTQQPKKRKADRKFSFYVHVTD